MPTDPKVSSGIRYRKCFRNGNPNRTVPRTVLLSLLTSCRVCGRDGLTIYSSICELIASATALFCDPTLLPGDTLFDYIFTYITQVLASRYSYGAVVMLHSITQCYLLHTQLIVHLYQSRILTLSTTPLGGKG